MSEMPTTELPIVPDAVIRNGQTVSADVLTRELAERYPVTFANAHATQTKNLIDVVIDPAFLLTPLVRLHRLLEFAEKRRMELNVADSDSYEAAVRIEARGRVAGRDMRITVTVPVPNTVTPALDTGKAAT